MIQRCRAIKERLIGWWRNPGRWCVVFIYTALVMCVLGTVMVSGIILNINESIKASDESMAEDRANLQSQIDFLDTFLRTHSHTGSDLPEGGS